jgi:hypothetical protein
MKKNALGNRIFVLIFLKIIINVFFGIVYYKHKFIIAIIFFLSLAVFRFILNKLPFKWYKVPTMLLEKVSIHTEILFVHCYKFFLLLLVFKGIWYLTVLTFTNRDHSPNFFRQTSLLFHKWLAERFNLDDVWIEVPTMLLEKVSIHTEILFVHCYKFFLLLLVLFLCLLKIVYYCLKV